MIDWGLHSRKMNVGKDANFAVLSHINIKNIKLEEKSFKGGKY